MSLTEEQRRINFCIQMLEKVRDGEGGDDLQIACSLNSTAQELSALADIYMRSVEDANSIVDCLEEGPLRVSRQQVLPVEFSQIEIGESFKVYAEYLQHQDLADTYRKLDDDWAQLAGTDLPPTHTNRDRKFCIDTPVVEL